MGSGKSEGPRTIAVFGSSEPLPGEALYAQARELGHLLARDGYAVLTGGYGGVMEAASRGAAEAGGRAVGVTCSTFTGRQPNPYLTREIATDDLHRRTATLIELAHGFVVMPGKAGTLAELAQLWALHRAGCLEDRPVVLLGAGWEALLHHLVEAGIVETSQRRISRIARDPEEAVRAIAGADSWKGSTA